MPSRYSSAPQMVEYMQLLTSMLQKTPSPQSSFRNSSSTAILRMFRATRLRRKATMPMMLSPFTSQIQPVSNSLWYSSMSQQMRFLIVSRLRRISRGCFFSTSEDISNMAVKQLPDSWSYSSMPKSLGCSSPCEEAWPRASASMLTGTISFSIIRQTIFSKQLSLTAQISFSTSPYTHFSYFFSQIPVYSITHFLYMPKHPATRNKQNYFIVLCNWPYFFQYYCSVVDCFAFSRQKPKIYANFLHMKRKGWQFLLSYRQMKLPVVLIRPSRVSQYLQGMQLPEIILLPVNLRILRLGSVSNLMTTFLDSPLILELVTLASKLTHEYTQYLIYIVIFQ